MVKELKGPNLELEEGQSYRAKVRLSGSQCLGTANQIKEKFEDLGFVSVEVFTSADELPKDWPLEEREIAAPFMSCGRFAQGVWGKASDALPRQEEIVKMWLWEKVAAREAGAGTPVWAANILGIAWQQEEPDVELDPVTRQALLAISRHESNFGWPNALLNPQWQGKHNWGAITYTPPGPGSLHTGFFFSEDGPVGGEKEQRKFRAYPSAVDGARDFVRFFLHRKEGPEMYAAFRSGNATRIATVMRKQLHYFEADIVKGRPADAPAIARYAKGIEFRAKDVALALGEKPLVLRRANRGWWALVPVVAGVGYAGYHYRDELFAG